MADLRANTPSFLPLLQILRFPSSFFFCISLKMTLGYLLSDWFLYFTLERERRWKVKDKIVFWKEWKKSTEKAKEQKRKEEQMLKEKIENVKSKWRRRDCFLSYYSIYIKNIKDTLWRIVFSDDAEMKTTQSCIIIRLRVRALAQIWIFL